MNTAITLITIKRGRVQYGAGQCVVTIGTAPLEAIAVMAGKERHITTADYAHEWLMQHGLDGDIALTLINAAQGDEFALKLLGEEEKRA